MLCDMFGDFLRSDEAKQLHDIVLPPFRFMAEHIAQAPRYNLDRAALMMVQNISASSPSTFMKAMPLCRLPAPEIWVEFAFADRTDWLREAAKRHLVAPQQMDGASPPSRMGFLLRAITSDGEPMIEVNAGWTHGNGSVEVGWKQLLIATQVESKVVSPDVIKMMEGKLRSRGADSFSMEVRRHLSKPGEWEATANLEARMVPVVPRYWKPVFDAAPKAQRDYMHEHGDYDLASEWRFILALLAALNSRNLIKYEDQVEYGPLNKKRQRQGKAPLLSHRPITLNLSPVQRRRVMNYIRDQGIRARPDDPQFVMGHLKLRKTGIFWWAPHERYGSGATPREYRVTA